MNKFDRVFSRDDSDHRQYHCKYCNFISCRDISGARNILIKNENIKQEDKEDDEDNNSI